MFIKVWSVDDEVLIISKLVLCTAEKQLINLSVKLKFFLLFFKFFHIISYIYKQCIIVYIRNCTFLLGHPFATLQPRL